MIIVGLFVDIHVYVTKTHFGFGNRKEKIMIKGKYKVIALALAAATLFGVSAYSATKANEKGEPIAYYTPCHMTTEKYVAYYEGNDTFVTEDDDAWVVYDAGFDKGDRVILSITNNGTVEKVDDVVLNIKAKPNTYDVPLSKEFQEYIIDVCKGYPQEINGVHLELVLAVIERESNYNPSEIGDNGNAYGLMQVHPSQHWDRMERLGVTETDLLDPYKNVLVGIDYLAECLRENETLDEALTVYNAGASGAYEHYFSKGILGSDYAYDVMTKHREICMSHVK